MGVGSVTVAITGAQGVGKSTLVNSLAGKMRARGCACNVHDRIGTIAMTEGVPLGEATDVSTICQFASLHVGRESAIHSGVHILDRCFVDLLAYARVRCSDDMHLVALIEALARQSIQRLDHVVYVPMIESLSLRSSAYESAAFRHMIDQAIGAVLKELGVQAIEVKGTTDERADMVIDILGLTPGAGPKPCE